MNRSLDSRSSTCALGSRLVWSPGRALVLATVASLFVGCGGGEQAPAGLPEGVTEFSPKVESVKRAKPARGKPAVDTGSSAPAS